MAWKKDRIIGKTGRSSKHTRYLTTKGKICPGGSTVARVITFGFADNLIRWAVRLSEECEHCGLALAKECSEHGAVSGRDHEQQRTESAEYGKCFHRAVECWYKEIPFDEQNFVGAYVAPAKEMLVNFQAELARMGLRMLGSEVSHTSDELETGGTMDLILTDDLTSTDPVPNVLGDLKSSNFLSGEHVLQVGGVYRRLFIEKWGKCDKVVLFRGDRDSRKVTGHVIPEEHIEAANELAPLARRAYDLKKVLERRF